MSKIVTTNQMKKDIKKCENLALQMDLQLHEKERQEVQNDYQAERLETAVEKDDDTDNEDDLVQSSSYLIALQQAQLFQKKNVPQK